MCRGINNSHILFHSSVGCWTQLGGSSAGLLKSFTTLKSASSMGLTRILRELDLTSSPYSLRASSHGFSEWSLQPGSEWGAQGSKKQMFQEEEAKAASSLKGNHGTSSALLLHSVC